MPPLTEGFMIYIYPDLNGDDRVIRGGAWNSLPEFCTVSARLVFKQINTSYSFGFRACR